MVGGVDRSAAGAGEHVWGPPADRERDPAGPISWRSEAALAQLARGDRESAERLVVEELELARAFGAPRALGVALRAAGVVAGGDRGALLLREAIDALERGDARLERVRALADLGAMLRRRNRPTEARELLREALDAAHRAGAKPSPNTPRPSSARPVRARAGSCSEGSTRSRPANVGSPSTPARASPSARSPRHSSSPHVRSRATSRASSASCSSIHETSFGQG
jgi:tetratricopeptide (TPR) repeat protein